MLYLSSSKLPGVLSSVGRALGKAETLFFFLVLWACKPCTADLWLLEQQGMLQRQGPHQSTGLAQGRCGFCCPWPLPALLGVLQAWDTG